MRNIDAVELTRALVRLPSVTPSDAGALDLVQQTLEPLGFRCLRLPFEEPGTPRIDNLYARWGEARPVFCFAGHTDVVPVGDAAGWSAAPFGADIRDGAVWGRGAADMKGAIAAFIAAAERVIARNPAGSIALLITGDEEGPAVNGTKKALKAIEARGETIDHCLVGEPSSAATLGDMMKVGRRGSANCVLRVDGAQGHVAYPERASNPVHPFLRMLNALIAAPLDDGYAHFQPSSLQITDVHTGNPAHNVIPARAEAKFNIRFNPNFTGDTLEARLRKTLDEAAAGAPYALSYVCSGDAFLTRDEAFISLISDAVAARTGRVPAQSTTGGTSDARYVKDYAPVAEFGLVGATIHKVDEHAAVADIETLVDIYDSILDAYFRRASVPA